MNRFLLISISFLIFIIGIGCVSAASLDVDGSVATDGPALLGNGLGGGLGGGLGSCNPNAVADDGVEVSSWSDGDKSLYADDGVEVSNLVYQNHTPQYLGYQNHTPQYLDKMQPQPYNPVALSIGPDRRVFIEDLGNSPDRRVFVDAPALESHNPITPF